RALGGSGASGTPFLLTDIYGLQGMDGFPSGSFALANDIDASGTSNWNFTPVDDIDPRFPGYFAGFDPLGGGGEGESPFGGTLDGQGHTISGLYVNRDSAGLIEISDDA